MNSIYIGPCILVVQNKRDLENWCIFDLLGGVNLENEVLHAQSIHEGHPFILLSIVNHDFGYGQWNFILQYAWFGFR